MRQFCNVCYVKRNKETFTHNLRIDPSIAVCLDRHYIKVRQCCASRNFVQADMDPLCVIQKTRMCHQVPAIRQSLNHSVWLILVPFLCSFWVLHFILLTFFLSVLSFYPPLSLHLRFCFIPPSLSLAVCPSVCLPLTICVIIFYNNRLVVTAKKNHLLCLIHNYLHFVRMAWMRKKRLLCSSKNVEYRGNNFFYIFVFYGRDHITLHYCTLQVILDTIPHPWYEYAASIFFF